MEAAARFRHLPKSFWADVRTIGEAVGYTLPRQNMVRSPTIEDIRKAYDKLGIGTTHLVQRNRPTARGRTLVDYLEHRASVLNEYVAPRLMDVDRARAEFERLRSALNPSCPLPLNKQRGDKRAPAYLTGIVNMLVEAHSFGQPCDYDRGGSRPSPPMARRCVRSLVALTVRFHRPSTQSPFGKSRSTTTRPHSAAGSLMEYTRHCSTAWRSKNWP